MFLHYRYAKKLESQVTIMTRNYKLSHCESTRFEVIEHVVLRRHWHKRDTEILGVAYEVFLPKIFFRFEIQFPVFSKYRG